MDEPKAQIPPQLRTALLLHVNQSLFDRGHIPRRVYEETKVEISRRVKTT